MSARSLADRPDDYTGEQVKIIYAVPRGAADRQLDVTSKIPYSLSAANRWLESQIGRKVRFDTFNGDLDIQFVQLPKSDSEYLQVSKRLWIQEDMLHLLPPGKNTLVFYEGSNPSACGESSTAAAAHHTGQFSVVYLVQCDSTAPSPDSQPQWADYTAIHELFHAFGALHPPLLTESPPPNEYYQLHCDLMYTPKANACLQGQYLDPFRRFYYNPSGPVQGPVNTYHSPFLTPPP